MAVSSGELLRRGRDLRFLVKMPLYLVDVNRDLSQNHKKMLRKYYAVIDTYAGGDEPFNRFVEDYTKD